MEEKIVDQYEESRQKSTDVSKYFTPKSEEVIQDDTDKLNTEELEEVEKQAEQQAKEESQKKSGKNKKSSKDVGLFLRNLFTFGRLTYNPEEHAKYLERKALKHGETPFADLNKERLAHENGEFKTNVEISREKVFGKDFIESIKDDSVKLQTYDQIIRQMRKMEDPSKIDISLFKPEYDRDKTRLIFEAQKKGYDATIYKHLTTKACEVILNAQNNNLPSEKINELLNLPDEAMEERLGEMLLESGIKSSRQFIKEENGYLENIVNTTLDEELAYHREALNNEFRQNERMLNDQEKNSVGQEL